MPNGEEQEHSRPQDEYVRDPELRDALRPLAERLSGIYPEYIRYGFDADTTHLVWEAGMQFLNNGRDTRSVLFLRQQASRYVQTDAIPGYAKQEWDDFLSEIDDPTKVISSLPRQYENAVYYIDMDDGAVDAESYAELWASFISGHQQQQRLIANLDITKAVAARHPEVASPGQRSQHAWHILHILQELRVMNGFVAPEDVAAVRALLGYNR
jgi:hypothetical protein